MKLIRHYTFDAKIIYVAFYYSFSSSSWTMNPNDYLCEMSFFTNFWTSNYDDAQHGLHYHWKVALYDANGLMWDHVDNRR